MPQQRQTQTEAKIRAALTKLIGEKGLEGITTSAVAREAGINRGTFYAHYTDKFDLITKQVDAIIDDLTEILLRPSSEANARDLIPRQNVLDALIYVLDNYELVSALTDHGRSARLQTRFKEILGRLLEREASRYPQLTISYQGIPHDYGQEILLSSVTSIIWLWLRKGCVEAPEQICEFIYLNKDLSPAELLA